MPRCLLILGSVLVLMAGSVSAAEINADSLFAAATGHYENMEYDAALADYLKLEEAGYVSAPLYFNIGNCYFKQDEPGYAILYYLRAQRLDPTDEDIAGNLAFARQFMAVSMEGVQINPVTTFMDGLVKPFTLNQLAWLASILFIVFISYLCVIIARHYGGIGIRIIGYILVIVLLISSAMTTYKYRTDYGRETGVVIAPEANVYSGPGEGHDLEFVGSYGLTFMVERAKDNYYLVIFENKRKGWIEKQLVELL
ncbi:MAG: hypothetical protein JW763_06000 [candidate division Zixibacteria bacterium]|nr:hypothetical protein [candidate division Zixibacteria bacterium]